MKRAICTILIVAGLAAVISAFENASGSRQSPEDWLRTVDGWQQRSTMELPPRVERAEPHPGLIAAFQVSASILALLAFPSRARVLEPRSASRLSPARRRNRKQLATT